MPFTSTEPVVYPEVTGKFYDFIGQEIVPGSIVSYISGKRLALGIVIKNSTKKTNWGNEIQDSIFCIHMYFNRSIVGNIHMNENVVLIGHVNENKLNLSQYNLLLTEYHKYISDNPDN